MLPYKSGKCEVLYKYGFRADPANPGQEIFNGGLIMRGIGVEKTPRDIVVSVSDGTVIRSRYIRDREDSDWKMGNYIAILGDDGITVYYCHLQNRQVHTGQRVTAGTVLGREGTTGDVETKQLYLECRSGTTRINAAKYLGIRNVRGVFSDFIDEEEAKRLADERRFRKGNLVTIGARATTMSGTKIPADKRKGVFTVLRSRNQCALLKELWEWVPYEFLTKVDKRKTRERKSK